MNEQEIIEQIAILEKSLKEIRATSFHLYSDRMLELGFTKNDHEVYEIEISNRYSFWIQIDAQGFAWGVYDMQTHINVKQLRILFLNLKKLKRKSYKNAHIYIYNCV